MRAFIAIDLPDTVRRSLEEAVASFQKSGADVRWISGPNFHLTLKFLGEIEESDTPKIQAHLDEVSLQFKTFQFTVCGLGAFPDFKRPQVFWAGVAETERALERLAEALGNDRDFHAHVTLGRVRSRKNLEALMKIIKVSSWKDGEKGFVVPVGHLSFYKSTLTPQGSIYEIISEHRFS